MIATEPEDSDSDAIAQALRLANLIPSNEATAPATEDDSSNDVVLGALVGEAAALLKRKTVRDAWAIACKLWFNFDGALPSFRTRLQLDFRADRSFRERFETLADAIVDKAIADPAHRMNERDRDNFLALVENWRKARDLRSVWFGLPQMRHVFRFGEFDTLVYVYLAVDVARAAQSLDRFDNPYQIWAVLTGFGGLGLDQNFAAWADLLRHASPSFAADGSWTGRTLELLLLVIAQDALREARLPQDMGADVITARDDELKSLTSAISKRWGVWLFRTSAGTLDGEGQQYPKDLRQRATPLWRMLEALARSEAAKSWNTIPAPGTSHEEVLYLLCVKVLAASEGNSESPDREPLWRCLPTSPEDFLGEEGRPTRDLISLFSTHGARLDGLKYRMLSLLFFQGDPVALYREFWRRTLTLRELAEHWQSGEPNDGRNDAKQVLAMVLAVGLCFVDYYAVVSMPINGVANDRSERFTELFGLVYDGLREMQTIELFDQTFWSALYGHLLIRRALYENARAGDITVAAPLMPNAQPTLAGMLANIAGVTQQFFEGLDGLTRNGISTSRITMALEEGGINLPMLVDSARSLNKIDAHRPLQIEVAARIADQLSADRI